ncbi:hypothetical protein [Xenorhabdus cabanillasii]|uniref:Uncharacterized protein n=1 Tax=Xenorhabdus cabanillasii JM26 TaxID=1427517 RepID=W1J7W1_9GAMM|nr:hypothetical protein [Xenorhabdus cabanillasii]PHM76547.1 transposase [Xenorhabdus cabanillasii JM26]CDL86819.1 hypothetical protein XCR1_70016 [Xenorhabdus cabanillasii JM26]
MFTTYRLDTQRMSECDSLFNLDITSFHVDGEYKLPDDDEMKRIFLVRGWL